MNTDKVFLKRIGWTSFTFSSAIASCYFVFDKLIAYKMAEMEVPKAALLQGMKEIAMGCHIAAFLCIVFMSLKRLWKPLTAFENKLFILGVTSGVASYLKDFFKAIFGRFWPDTWIMNNLSLIKNEAYGFHFWHWSQAYGAFPSGHTTIVCCVMSYIWMVAPKWRLIALLIAILQIIPLIVFNYHFLGDILAGALLGSLSAAIAVKLNYPELEEKRRSFE